MSVDEPGIVYIAHMLLELIFIRNYAFWICHAFRL